MNDLKQIISKRLVEAGVDPSQADADAQEIVQFAQQHGDQAVQMAESMADRCSAGEPLSLVKGQAIFMGVSLIAAKGALVPRIETELLGYTALGVAREMPAPVIVDMCCGSGNLACALARHLPSARIWAADLTSECTDLARRNVAHLGLTGQVTVVQGDLFGSLMNETLNELVDMVVCNPPYISAGKLSGEKLDLLRYEPVEAFEGGPYGLTVHQRVIRESVPFLKTGGILFFEIGQGQERQVELLFKRVKAFEHIRMYPDVHGSIRVMSAVKRGNLGSQGEVL